MDADTFCREIEAYLCRKNDGHLVRVVGPAFAMVSRWAAEGIPFKVACRGIDRCFERYYAKGPRRRPVRVEFCEADVLDVYDEWRRAVGVGMAGGASGPDSAAQTNADATEPAGAGPAKPSHSLRAHLDRVVTRLTDVQARGALPAELDAAIEGTLQQLAGDRESSRTVRGEARAAYLVALEQLDGRVMDAARRATPPAILAQLRDEAGEELSGFRARMSPEAYERALVAAADKLLRDRWKLPVIAYS